MIVADTNLIIALTLGGENASRADEIFSKDPIWIAPPIWESEFRNAATLLCRAGRLNVQTALSAVMFAANTIQTRPVFSAAVLRIAHQHKLTAYDAEFAALGEALDCKVVSYDRELVKSGLAVHPDRF